MSDLNLRFCITAIPKDMRIMIYPHNQYGTYDTEREACDQLISIILNNTDSDIKSIIGDPSTALVMAVECYPSGDPKQTVFNY